MKVEACCLPHPNEENAYLLFLELGAVEDVSRPRRPVHLVLAIDASSSMGGPRLACAVEAARTVASRLGPEDVFCLLAFDRTVRTLFGPGKVDATARTAINAALSALRPGVGTALHAAIERSHELLRRVFVRETRPHAIILTDGFPSVGPTEPDAFAAMSRTATAEGIATSAVGVGVDFDEQAVAGIAAGGGGRYSFVDKESDIPGALALHLSDLFAIAIENVTVRVAPAGPIREAVLLHRYATRVGPDGFVIETGPIGLDNPRRLLFHLKASAPPSPIAATVALSARGTTHEPNRILSVPVAGEGPAAKGALCEYYRLSLSGREADFWTAIHRNDRASAAAALDGAELALASLRKAGAPESELDSDRGRLADARAVLEGRLSAEAREAARKRSHEAEVSRITSIGLGRLDRD